MVHFLFLIVCVVLVKKRKSKGAAADNHRKRQNVDPPTGRMTEVYWCLNPERFNIHFRHEVPQRDEEVPCNRVVKQTFHLFFAGNHQNGNRKSRCNGWAVHTNDVQDD